MPSVGMRRRTRVFGTRVLRSGRRLWMEPYGSNKHGRAAHGENKCEEHLEEWPDRRDVGTRIMDDWNELENVSVDLPREATREEVVSDTSMMEAGIDRMFGLVYRRKRKRIVCCSHVLAEDKRFGKKFLRREWKKRCRALESFETCKDFLDAGRMFGELGIAIQEPSCDFSLLVSRLLYSLLGYISRFRVGIRLLYTFLLSKPLFDVYSSVGLLFFQDAFISRNPGFCIISGSGSSIPLLYVTFPAIPSLFMHMQTYLYFRCLHFAYLLVSDEYEDVLGLYADDTEKSSSGKSWNNFQEYVASRNDKMERWESFQLSFGLSKSAIQSVRCPKIQKRRSTLGRRKSIPLSSEYSGSICDIRRSLEISAENIKEVKSAPYFATQIESTPICHARILVTDTDKCYREEGITISLESTVSYWFLAIQKNGTRCYSLIAQKVMRPSSSNRFTHSIVWGETGDWKLEFPSKKDWIIFKELYKECFERNTTFHSDTIIPVPRVQDVSYCADDSYYVPFVRPASYITVQKDELMRALENKCSNYDLDSDDEQWLAKLNDGGVLEELVTPDSFELIINALEKGVHCRPDENLSEQAIEFCDHLASCEVIEAVQNYWIQKRKQKRGTLIRVFQLYQPRRIQMIPKSIPRKKRSFKRQGTQRVNEKHVSLLQEISGEREALELLNISKKVHDAAAAAEGLEELAILTRQKAQILMVNADLTTYKALMALRIAEAARISMINGSVAFPSILLA